MKKKLLLLLTFLTVCAVSFGQMDYSSIEFRSYIYKYKENQPRTSELGIDKELLKEIVALLGKDLYSKEQQEEIVYKTWLAMANVSLSEDMFTIEPGSSPFAICSTMCRATA